MNIIHQYLSGWGITFNDSFECQRYLNHHGLTEAAAMWLSSAMKLTFENGILSSVEDFEYGESMGIHDLHFSEKGFPYREITVHDYYQLEFDENGAHQIGGKAPEGFVLPPAINNSPFVYLGYITGNDPVFGWIGTEIIHLACPIFLPFLKLMVSARDPLHPKVVSYEVVVDSGDTNPVSENTFVEYEPIRFNPEINYSSMFMEEGLGNAGIPYWIQNPDVPAAGYENMRFLCQLRSNPGQHAITHNFDLSNYPYDPENFTTLNFWGDGDLFVFYDPTSKQLHYQIQNT